MHDSTYPRRPRTRRALSSRRSVGTLPALLIAVVALLAACGSPTDSPRRTPAPGPEPEPTAPGDTSATGLPSLGAAGTLEIASWNVAWFGSPDFDPADDSLQLARVRAVIAAADVDVWGLEEVVTASQWRSLLAALPEYEGVLASDPSVAGGPSYYEAKEQKPALLVRSDVARVRGARLALTGHNHAFAGRPPLEVTLEATVDGVTEKLIVLVVHMKAGADAESRARREAAATALKAYLDGTYPDDRVMVIGDFNDDVDTSIHAGSPTPFAAFVADRAWAFPTAALSAARISSMTRYPDLVDHHLYSDELLAGYVDGSARVVRLDEWIDGYEATTSDHFPVLTVYDPTP